MSGGCTFNFHISSLSKKYVNLSWLILRTFYTRDCITLLTLFKTYFSFKIHTRTGRIIVRDGQSLDYERTQKYVLTVLARDNLAEGHIGSAPLIITVGNENDNSPVFPVHGYVTYINEGATELRPRLQVEVSLDYSFVKDMG